MSMYDRDWYRDWYQEKSKQSESDFERLMRKNNLPGGKPLQKSALKRALVTAPIYCPHCSVTTKTLIRPTSFSQHRYVCPNCHGETYLIGFPRNILGQFAFYCIFVLGVMALTALVTILILYMLMKFHIFM